LKINKIPDQDETYQQYEEYFFQLLKLNKKCFVHNYEWYIQKKSRVQPLLWFT